MRVSLNWLKEMVEIDLPAEEVADLLTMGGLEVENVIRVGDGLNGVMTARIEDIKPHPNAANLSIADLSVGDRSVAVVCGAPNIRVGQVVPYAGPGTVLSSGNEIIEIAERVIKGVASPGMICSEKELELGEDAAGILVLEDVAETGIPLVQACPFIEDAILETGVTPNRGDCLSVLGTARELAALVGKPWRAPEFVLEEGSVSIHDRAAVEVPDYDLCPRYVARMVEGVSIGPSPFRVRYRLFRAGLRPISNVVDATNLLLLECGQPLHAFDYTLLAGGRIVVRRCAMGETFVTLDGVERKLPENALMIRDAEKSVALGGIMGGLNSEIQDATTSVLIESACFEPFGIRRTAKALGMSTEASFRFERGVDPKGSLWAAHRAAFIVQQLAGGTILSGHIDVYPEPITRPAVTVEPAKITRLLGVEVTARQSGSYLERLGIGVRIEDGDGSRLTCTPPSWRWDLDRDVDMIEEVGRVHGFQHIPVSMPAYVSAPDKTHDHHKRIRGVAGAMSASGFTEIITMSFCSSHAAKEFTVTPSDGSELRLLNPLTEDTAVMRPTLLAGMMAGLKRNLNFKSEDLRLYEIGKVFLPNPGNVLPSEELRLAAVATGRRYPHLWHYQRGEIDLSGKVDKEPEVDFYDMKGAIENVLEWLDCADAVFVPSSVQFLHPGKSADIVVEGATIGFVGELSPQRLREHDLTHSVQVFEIALEPLFVLTRKEKVFRPIPRYPYVERDLSVIVERNCSGDMIKRLISRLGHDIIVSVVLFDLYRGEPVPDGYQSVTLRIRYQSEDRTLTDEEVQEVHSRVVEAVSQELGATLRE